MTDLILDELPEDISTLEAAARVRLKNRIERIECTLKIIDDRQTLLMNRVKHIERMLEPIGGRQIWYEDKFIPDTGNPDAFALDHPWRFYF